MRNMPDIKIEKQKERDVTPLTLSIETADGICLPLIKRGTPIPVSKVSIFTTTVENQSSLKIHVLQGERKMVVNNKTLGRFIVDGIPPAPRGILQIEVHFNIDAKGVLNVKAKDKTTDHELKITIIGSAGVSQKEIDKMKKDAEMHAEEDKKIVEITKPSRRS